MVCIRSCPELRDLICFCYSSSPPLRLFNVFGINESWYKIFTAKSAKDAKGPYFSLRPLRFSEPFQKIIKSLPLLALIPSNTLIIHIQSRSITIIVKSHDLWDTAVHSACQESMWCASIMDRMNRIDWMPQNNIQILPSCLKLSA